MCLVLAGGNVGALDRRMTTTTCLRSTLLRITEPSDKELGQPELLELRGMVGEIQVS